MHFEPRTFLYDPDPPVIHWGVEEGAELGRQAGGVGGDCRGDDGEQHDRHDQRPAQGEDPRTEPAGLLHRDRRQGEDAGADRPVERDRAEAPFTNLAPQIPARCNRPVQQPPPAGDSGVSSFMNCCTKW